MAAPSSCRACGEPLGSIVRFCPFCGAAQQPAADTAPAPVAAPDPVVAARHDPPTVAAGTATAPRASDAAAPEPAVAVRFPNVMVPPPAPVVPQPAPQPSSAWGARRAPAAAIPVVPVVPHAPAPRAPRTAAPRPPRSPVQRAARTAALRKLLLAAVILGCGAVLWHHLTGGPHGTVTVHLTQAADGRVLIDGSTAGPPDQPIRLEPGRHVIGFAATDWTTREVTIRLRDGETRTVELLPVPHRATLSIDSMPAGARLSLGTRRLGSGPRTLVLAPGAYRVGAVLPGYVPTDQPVELRAGEQRSLVVMLQPTPVRTLHLLAPAGSWSEPVTLASGDRFVLSFHGRIRVRCGGHVVLLDGGQAVRLGVLDEGGLAFTAVGGDAVPVDLLVRTSGSPG